MSKAALRWPAGCLSLVCLLAAAPAWADALQDELLQSAQRWSAKNRTDVARQMVAKLLAVQPDSPEGLAFLGDMALRENKLEEARRILTTLQTIHPLHPATRDLQQLYQVYSQQREKLARMRLMARAGRGAEAAAIAQELFPDGPPRFGGLGAEIARILGQSRSGTLVAQPPAAGPARSSTGAAAGRLAAGAATARNGRAAAKSARNALAPQPAAERPDPDAQARLEANQTLARAADLRAQAEAQLKGEHLSPALRLLEDALQLTPDDAWLRYDLARLYLRLQLPAQARSVVDEGAALLPTDTDMRYVRALTLAAMDADAEALADLQRTEPEDRTAGMQALERRLSVNLLVAQAADPAQRDLSLQKAEALAGDDPELLRTVTNAWFRGGLPAQGAAVLGRRLARAPAAPAVRLEYAQLLNRAEDDATLGAQLPTLLALPDWSAADRATLLALHVDHTERRIAQQMQTGNTAGALTLARAPLPAQPDSGLPAVVAWRQQAQARLLQAAGDNHAAAGLLEQALRQSPDDAGMRLALGNARVQQGRIAEARTEALWLQTHVDPTDLYRRLAVLRLLQRAGAADAARAESQALLARYPADVDVLLHAARLERSEGQYSQALGLFQQAQQSERTAQQAGAQPDAQTLDKIGGDIAAIEARRQAWVEVGQFNLEKNSTEGISSLRGWERPVVAWLPWGYEGQMFAHVDPVQLDAGNYAGLGAYGRHDDDTSLPAASQRADGANAGLGYQGDNLRWDIGETGIGFPVHNWVGGLRYSGDIGKVDYNVEASRRPLTGTLLSYAGAVDPVTGGVWGGVVATGVGGRLAKDIGIFSTSLSASVATLTGQNVADNSRLKWRVAADRDVYSSKQQTVNVGLSLSGLHHDKDLSGFTWGHGGYYSPVRNVSLALPVEWSGRQGPFTWLLKASVSVSDSYSSATDYYPTLAGNLASGKVYSGGGSSGTGYSYSGTAEYQVNSQLALGARLDREVSDYYTPLNLLFYARFLLDPVREPLANRPRPVQAYSQF